MAEVAVDLTPLVSGFDYLIFLKSTSSDTYYS